MYCKPISKNSLCVNKKLTITIDKSIIRISQRGRYPKLLKSVRDFIRSINSDLKGNNLDKNEFFKEYNCITKIKRTSYLNNVLGIKKSLNFNLNSIFIFISKVRS